MSLPSDREDSRAVLVLGVAAWAGAVACAASENVFARISPAAALALAALAAIAAPGALLLDRNLREQVRRLPRQVLAAGFMLCALAVLVGSGALLRRHGFDPQAATTGAYAFVTYFVAPLGLAMLVAAVQRLGARLRRSAPATSPASTRAAPRKPHTNARDEGAARA
jgi:hypothetical protein